MGKYNYEKMKVQNTVTLEQAKSLDKAIREAGLKWPGIEWESQLSKVHWKLSSPGLYIGGYEIYSKLAISGIKLQISQEKREGILVSDHQFIPAPNLAELLAMLPPIFDCNTGEVTVENCANRLTESIKMTPKTITAHWDKIENP